MSLSKLKSNTNISVVFGVSVDKEQKDKDWQEINELLSNLSKITNQKIKVSQQNINMYVVIANQKEIKDLIDEIGSQRPEFDPKRIPIISFPKTHTMAMASMSSEPNSAISSALVIIRNELPDIMRACILRRLLKFGLNK